jgi:hypothetical protein
MLCVVVGQTKEYRKKIIETLLQKTDTAGESLIRITDNDGDVSLLREYLYPSLFSIETPVVHAKYVLSISEFTKKVLEELHMSPTVFIIEELALLADQKKMITSLIGTSLYIEEKKNPPAGGAKSTAASPFAFIDTVEKKGKKEVWMAYNKLLENGGIEAALGMLLWGLRKLALRKGVQQTSFKELYANCMKAYAYARAHNTPLELAIEKVLLQR